MNPRIIDQIAEDAARLYEQLYGKIPQRPGEMKQAVVAQIVAHAMPAIVESYTK